MFCFFENLIDPAATPGGRPRAWAGVPVPDAPPLVIGAQNLAVQQAIVPGFTTLIR